MTDLMNNYSGVLIVAILIILSIVAIRKGSGKVNPKVLLYIVILVLAGMFLSWLVN